MSFMKKATLLSNIFYVLFFFIYWKIFSIGISNYPFPDETAAFNIFTIKNFIGGIYYYWHDFIGRPTAIAWLALPIKFSKLLHIDPWISLVGARLINGIAIMVCLAFLIKSILPRISFLASTAISSLLLSSVLVSLGTTAIKYYWLVDQSIYGFSFMTFCLLMGSFLHMILQEDNKKNWQILFFFSLYIGAHEINLASGGLILIICLISLFIYKEDSNKNRLYLIKYLSIIYIIIACLIIFSPSVNARLQFFPIEKSWQQSIHLGFVAGFFPLFEIFLGIKGAIIPIILLGITIGWFHGYSFPEFNSKIKKYKVLALLLPIIIALLLSQLMAILSSRYLGLMDPFYNFFDAKIYSLIKNTEYVQLPTRQNLYAYNLMFTGIFIAGILIGFLIKEFKFIIIKKNINKYFFYCIGIFSIIWILWIITFSSTFSIALKWDLIKRIREVSAWLEPLKQPIGFNNKRYLEEPPPLLYSEWGWDKNPIGHPKGTTYPLGIALQTMYRLNEAVIFVPCQIINSKDPCIFENKIWRVRELNSEKIDLKYIWINKVDKNIHRKNSKEVIFSQDHDKNYLSSISFSKSDKTLIKISITIDDINDDINKIELIAASSKNKKMVSFNLKNKEINFINNDATVLDGSIKELSNIKNKKKKFNLSARFVVADQEPNFKIVLLSHSNNPRSNLPIVVSDTKIRILDTGTNKKIKH
jgi:hypothetical protein